MQRQETLNTTRTCSSSSSLYAINDPDLYLQWSIEYHLLLASSSSSCTSGYRSRLIRMQERPASSSSRSISESSASISQSAPMSSNCSSTTPSARPPHEHNNLIPIGCHLNEMPISDDDVRRGGWQWGRIAAYTRSTFDRTMMEPFFYDPLTMQPQTPGNGAD